jgi:dTDP-4-dehydrorhamnose reductase
MSADARPALVLGANGLIGRRLGAGLDALGVSWRGTRRARPQDGLLPLDLTDAAAVTRVFDTVRPGIVYHAANLGGGVDFCEHHPVEAEAFHLDATRSLVTACREHDATLVFVSTDYVFDGTGEPGEDDPTHPLNRYGSLKLAAERLITTDLTRHVIARTTNVFGWDPETVTPNFLMGLVRALDAGKPMCVPSYLWGNPTDAADLAAALIELATTPRYGLWHVVGASYVDRLTWARRACEVLGLDAGLLREVSDPPAGMVPRPLHSRLSTTRFTSVCTTPLHDLEHGLEIVRDERERSRGI